MKLRDSSLLFAARYFPFTGSEAFLPVTLKASTRNARVNHTEVPNVLLDSSNFGINWTREWTVVLSLIVSDSGTKLAGSSFPF